MGSFPSPPIPPHQYPLAIQLKLYQAFIFSIPILFSIILFLLFYLFYLKRRAYAASSMQPVLPRTNNDVNIATVESGSINELKNKLCKIIYDADIEARELLCCVCLGEYEAREELVEVATCKHMFHGDCISHWLRNHSTCPLCRAPVFVVLQHQHHYISHPAPDLTTEYGESNHQHHYISHPPPDLIVEYRDSDHQQVDMPTPRGESSSGSTTTC